MKTSSSVLGANANYNTPSAEEKHDAEDRQESRHIKSNAEESKVHSSPDTATARAKNRKVEYVEFTLTELINQAAFGEVEKIPKPSGTGGRNFNIRVHMGLDTGEPDDKQLYREIMVSPIFI